MDLKKGAKNKGRHLSSELFLGCETLRPDGDIFFQL